MASLVEEKKAELQQLKARLENEVTQLQAQIETINKQLYELQDKSFTVTDARSGRTFTLTRNPYELSKKYPKVHPLTGERTYRESTFWRLRDDGKTYTIASTMLNSFPDQEFVEKTWDDEYHKVYDDDKGWALPGYYWRDVSGTFGPTEYSESKIPEEKDKMPASKKSRKHNK
jgi:hypothetical protein